MGHQLAAILPQNFQRTVEMTPPEATSTIQSFRAAVVMHLDGTERKLGCPFDVRQIPTILQRKCFSFPSSSFGCFLR